MKSNSSNVTNLLLLHTEISDLYRTIPQLLKTHYVPALKLPSIFCFV